MARTSSLPEAQPGYRWELQVPGGAPRRRSPVGWIIAVVLLVAFLVGAWFVGDWLARDITQSTIRNTVIAQLGLPKDQQVDVELDGSVLYQLIVGSLDEVTVSSDDVALGPVTGDVVVHATDVPVRGGGPVGGGTAQLTLDEAQLKTLMGSVEGFPADTLGLAAPNVTMTYPAQVLGISFPIGVALTPSAAEGDLVLTPASFTLGDADIAADDLRNRFGDVAKTVLAPVSVCIAEYIPAGMTLSGVAVQGAGLVADFRLSGGILTDPTLRDKGTCS